ncbi:ADOP family duplicated permease [Acidicapsa dinghuensis]|uniref:ADOP family duplicated permease n=1 Tax=Acidicapsa dinghuensis TaxID=2218256 RepID=A0ABW1E9R9_9BACT|nr:ABC transporter permease [Acidicapsa dinghuensis]
MKWWQIRKRDEDLQRELQSDLELEAEEQRERGLSPEEARRAALRAFGNPTLIREQTHASWSTSWLESFAQDLRYGIRGMFRNPGSTIFAILIVGLGIGGASTVFSVVNALLLRPLPFHDPRQLVWIGNGDCCTAQIEQYVDLRNQNKSFSDLAGWAGDYSAGNEELTGSGESQRITAVAVTGNFFPLLGVNPIIGRSFTAAEAEGIYRAPTALLISNSFWRHHFASDPGIVGRKITLNNQPVTVIGILPASFDFSSIFDPGTPVDVFIPWPLIDQKKPSGNTTKIIGRLKPGVTVQNATAELTTLAQQLNTQHPERNPVHPRLVPLEQYVSGQVRPALIVLMCAVGVVMLIVCANLSHLQLARMSARQKEMAVRAALGASRMRLLRQVLTESITLSLCGAALGLILAIAGTRELAHLTAFNLPLLASIHVDTGTLAFTLSMAVAAGVLFGLAPALQVPAYRLREGLQDAGRESSGGSRHNWFRNSLVISEFALACILLVGAALLIQSFLHVLDVDLGFQPERAATLRIDPSFKMANLQQQNSFLDDALGRVRAIPGVTAAGVADVLPLDGDRSWQITGKGQVYDKNNHPEAYIRVVTDGYFAALGIQLKSGREFTQSDRATTEPVVMVNETFARTLWPGQNAVGQIVTQDGGRRVIGVVADVHHGGPELSGGLEMYIPMRQSNDYPSMRLIVRTALTPDSLAAGIRTALRPIDPNLPVTELQTLQQFVDRQVSPRRFLVMLLTGFAAFALLLASLGIYALISYSVSQRTKEIGIRMALGASASLVQRSVLTRTLQLALAGVVLGTLGSFALSRWMTSLLFGTTPTNPAVFTGVSLLLCAVALIAAYVPARRAARIEPLHALRTE